MNSIHSGDQAVFAGQNRQGEGRAIITELVIRFYTAGQNAEPILAKDHGEEDKKRR